MNLPPLFFCTSVTVNTTPSAVMVPVVGHLTAHLGVEGGLIQHHHGLGSGGYLFPQLLIGHDGHDLGVVFVVVIAHEFRGRHVLAEFHTGPA